jgi:hypothetical protein
VSEQDPVTRFLNNVLKVRLSADEFSVLIDIMTAMRVKGERSEARATAAEQKLVAAERDTIERCAKVADSFFFDAGTIIGYAIRRLANQGEGNG